RLNVCSLIYTFSFFFYDTSSTKIYTLSLHDALPICIGELLSTSIISHYLNEVGISNQWFDVRDIIKTDANFRDANINIPSTQQNIIEQVLPVLENNKLVLTQGFIASTDENESTTLGREGSDYSAAIFANLLNAESLTIWKDVESIMNADPKEVPH